MVLWLLAWCGADAEHGAAGVHSTVLRMVMGAAATGAAERAWQLPSGAPGLPCRPSLLYILADQLSFVRAREVAHKHTTKSVVRTMAAVSRNSQVCPHAWRQQSITTCKVYARMVACITSAYTNTRERRLRCKAPEEQYYMLNAC